MAQIFFQCSSAAGLRGTRFALPFALIILFALVTGGSSIATYHVAVPVAQSAPVSTTGIATIEVNRAAKGNKLPPTPDGLLQQEKPKPVRALIGCEPAVSPLASRLPPVVGRCLT